MSNYKTLYPSIRTCQSETEISNLFERHMKLLVDEKQKMINEILEWEHNLIRQIQENVNKQKNLLEQQCKYQLDNLQIKRREYLDTALIYEDRKNREEVRQLLEQCHELKFGLGSFDYPEQTILFIQIQKLPIEVNQESVDLFQVDQNPTINDDFRIDNSRNVHTFENSNQINKTDMVDRCPACSMIFPSTMKPNERAQHVNQHFGDN